MKKIELLRNHIKNFLMETCDIPEEQLNDPNTKLADLDIDSIDKADLILQIEDDFNLKVVDDRELVELETVGSFTNYFVSLLKETKE